MHYQLKATARWGYSLCGACRVHSAKIACSYPNPVACGVFTFVEKQGICPTMHGGRSVVMYGVPNEVCGEQWA